MERETQSYNDFVVTHENCEREPIHRIQSIQSHGALIVVLANKPEVLFAISEDVPEMFGLSQAEVFNSSSFELLPTEITDRIEALKNAKSYEKPTPFAVQIGSSAFDCTIHYHDKKTFVELEPSMESDSTVDVKTRLKEIIEEVENCNTEEQLLNKTARLTRGLTQYHRVNIYTFDPNGHGHIIAESLDHKMESYFDQRFPATDIPQIARNLFMLSRVRLNYDYFSENKTILFNPDYEGEHLDQTYGKLRASSPVHIEYSRNIGSGLRGSLVASIIKDEKLWGLISCHHYNPRRVSFEIRDALETIMESFSVKLSEFEIKENDRINKENVQLAEQLFSNIQSRENLVKEHFHYSTELKEALKADGIAIVSRAYGCESIGITPDANELHTLSEILDQQEVVFSTQHLSDYTPEIAKNGNVEGLLSIRCDNESSEYIMCFRKPESQTSYWMGNPDKPFIEERDETNRVTRISPRTSFEKWMHAVEDRSLTWTKQQLDLAHKLTSVVQQF